MNSSKKGTGGGRSAKSGSTARKPLDDGSADPEKGSSSASADQMLLPSEGMSPETHEPIYQSNSFTPGGMESSGVFGEEPTLTELIVEQYEGDRHRGLFEGDGFVMFTSNNFYEGMFTEGMMHGEGTFTWTEEKTVYKGEFFRNQITGKGSYQWADGSYYEGEVFEGIRHGYGIYRHPSGITYAGRWNHGKRHGEGRLEYDESGKSFYEGEWRDNIPHGWGSRQYRSGNTYKGTWFNGVRHGQGTMHWLDRDEVYIGNWEDGIQHGMGQYIWYVPRVKGSQYPLRNVYDGQFCRGRRDGYGVFYYPNGARYEGEWRNDLKWGKGKFIFKNGRVYEGEFERDRIKEFPNAPLDGRTTPDCSIRTRSPLPCEAASVISTESRNTMGPAFQLYVGHLLEDLACESLIGVEEEMHQVTNIIMRNLGEFRRVYNFYSALGFQEPQDNTFVMNNLQFWRFIKDCRIHHNDLSLSDIDRHLQNSWAGEAPKGDIHNPTKRMLFLDFVNHLVTLSYIIYKKEIIENIGDQPTSILSTCMMQLISGNIRPYACQVGGFVFRNPKRLTHALPHMEKAYLVYQSLCKPRAGNPSESVMKMREFLYMLKNYRLINENLSATAIVQILSCEDPAVSDGECINLEREMTFLEFFEALVGCAEIFVTDSMIKDSNTPREPGMDFQDYESLPDTDGEAKQRDFSPPLSAPESSATPAEDTASLGTSTPAVHTGAPSEARKSIAAESGGATGGGETGRSGSKRGGHQRGSGRGSSKNVAAAQPPVPPPEPPAEEAPPPEVEAPVESTAPDPELAALEDAKRAVEEEMRMDDLDAETRAFNFWTHQLHIFFIRKLFPAAERYSVIRNRLNIRHANEMAEKMKRFIIESNKSQGAEETIEEKSEELPLSSRPISVED